MYSRTSAVNWICERKSKKLRQSEERGSLKRERGEDWGKGKEKEVFKWVCGKAGWHWNRHAPSHNGRDINFSTLSVSPLPSLFLSLPLSFPPSALPLHLASSRSLTPFPLFHSFSLLRSSFLFLFCLHHPTLLFLPAFFFLRLNSPLSSLCLPQSVSSLRIWQRFHLFWHPRLLPLSLSADFFLFTASRSSLNLFFFSTHILRFSPLQMLKCPFYRLSLSLTIRGGLTASPSWPSMSGPRLGRESQDHRVTLQKKKNPGGFWHSGHMAEHWGNSSTHTGGGDTTLSPNRHPVWRNGLCPLWPVGMSAAH